MRLSSTQLLPGTLGTSLMSDSPPKDQNAAPEAKPIRLGGMALRNGLLIHGPTHWSAAVRKSDGELIVASARKPKLAPTAIAKLPGLRGPIRLGEAMLVVPVARLKMRAMRLPYEDLKVLAAAGLSALLSRIVRTRIKVGAQREAAMQVSGLIPALAALTDRELTAYHGAEHKVIGAHEQGLDDPTPVPKEHDRCGSNLIAPLMLLSIGGTVLVERLFDRPGPIVRGLTSLAGASLAVEMFAWSERNRDHAAARAFHAQGRAIQRYIATSEPSPAQLEVGMAALAEILRVETGSDAEDDLPVAAAAV